MNERELRLEVVKRAPLLEALRGQPRSMGELDERLDVSRSTIHRALGTFEELNVVRKTDRRYGLTGFGRTITERTSEFSREIATAWDLDEFLNAVDGNALDVPMEYFADAEVIRPEPRTAHRGVKRIIDLIEESDSLRMFSNILSPLYVDVAAREMVEGMEIEVIFDDCLRSTLHLEYADEATEAFRTGRFEVHFGADIPFELLVADDRMAMAAHNESAVPRMFVETDAAAAVSWAEDLFVRYREDADWFDPATLGVGADAEVLQPIDD